MWSGTTPLADIHIGATVFTQGIAFNPDDLNPNANKQSQTRSASGKGKHFGIVLEKTATGIIVAGTATFNGSTTIVGQVKTQSEPFWIPVVPATKEGGITHDPVSRSAGDATKHKWINIRTKHTIPGTAFKLTPEAYPASVVATIKTALGM
ncbi:hypothetical protein QCA50_013198 [Cerrena zonata]|uniref:Uncharacterized protein n=1 Tax=Cerrena zonata TaxID=2478898 RepID=A0AAW0FWX5_9APHY